MWTHNNPVSNLFLSNQQFRNESKWKPRLVTIAFRKASTVDIDAWKFTLTHSVLWGNNQLKFYQWNLLSIGNNWKVLALLVGLDFFSISATKSNDHDRESLPSVMNAGKVQKNISDNLDAFNCQRWFNVDAFFTAVEKIGIHSTSSDILPFEESTGCASENGEKMSFNF